MMKLFNSIKKIFKSSTKEEASNNTDQKPKVKYLYEDSNINMASQYYPSKHLLVMDVGSAEIKIGDTLVAEAYISQQGMTIDGNRVQIKLWDTQWKDLKLTANFKIYDQETEQIVQDSIYTLSNLYIEDGNIYCDKKDVSISFENKI